MVEIVQPFTQQPIAKSYIYKVFENLQLLWVGIWLPTHTITTTDISPDLGELAEILDDVSVEMIPLCYHWGCRTFQTASHIHVIHIPHWLVPVENSISRHVWSLTIYYFMWCTTFSRWNKHDPRYDSTIDDVMTIELWKSIKRYFKLNNNLITKPRGMESGIWSMCKVWLYLQVSRPQYELPNPACQLRWNERARERAREVRKVSLFRCQSISHSGEHYFDFLDVVIQCSSSDD